MRGACSRLLNPAMLQQVIKERRRLDDLSKERVLEGARIIGCTTTGAAMYKDLLSTAKPSIVMVEEAGEILEAHVLTSMDSNYVKKLILIGDHKQLRPKAEVYDLTVQAGKGYRLNMSLFERLVLEGYPHSVLAVSPPHAIGTRVSIAWSTWHLARRSRSTCNCEVVFLWIYTIRGHNVIKFPHDPVDNVHNYNYKINHLNLQSLQSSSGVKFSEWIRV